MLLWRISAFPGLNGSGGQQTDGRWHTRPRPVLYASEHPALAMVEVLAHMRLSFNNIPLMLKLIAIDVADNVTVTATPTLPKGWQANEPTSQTLGNQWLDSGASLLLPVPSALVPHATNYLINTRHPQATTHLTETIEPFWFDKRYLPATAPNLRPAHAPRHSR
jgi:RES domain-containing protein